MCVPSIWGFRAIRPVLYVQHVSAVYFLPRGLRHGGLPCFRTWCLALWLLGWVLLLYCCCGASTLTAMATVPTASSLMAFPRLLQSRLMCETCKWWSHEQRDSRELLTLAMPSLWVQRASLSFRNSGPSNPLSMALACGTMCLVCTDRIPSILGVASGDAPQSLLASLTSAAWKTLVINIERLAGSWQ